MLLSRLPVFLGFALIIASGYVHGVLTDRWGTSADLEAAAARFENIPLAFGNWYSEPMEIPESELEAAEAVGHFARVYRNDETRTQIQVLAVCGAHGPISVHPPTICFTGAGYQQLNPETKQKIDAKTIEGTFFKTVFTKKTPEGSRIPLRTYWAWTKDGRCEAPDNPRVRFASSGHLYKVYVTRVLNPQDDPASDEASACEEFLEEFLPKLHAALSSQKPDRDAGKK